MDNQPKNSIVSQVASVVSLPGYKIIDVLGKGGMAVVYLAIQESIGRQVALKILAPDHTDDTFTDRFLREARIISNLTHPNIITVYDANVHQGCHYMSMEYVPGNSLRESRDKLTRKQKVDVIKQVAQALDYAGKKGYVHRDIKPENILLHEDGRAILTDFGIARSQHATKGLTITGKVIGTPYYMSPEQTKGMSVDHRSDVYSLGVVLFQALAGYLPYDGPSFVAIGIKHLSDPIPELPKGLELFQPIINICLSKDPAHRYQTASDLFAALEKLNDTDLDFIETKKAATNKTAQANNAKTIATGTIPPVVSARPKIKRYENSDAIVSIPDDLNVTDTDDFKRLNRRRRWILILLLICMAGVGYYKRAELTNFYQAELAPVIDPIVDPLIDKYLNNRGADGSTTKPTPLIATEPKTEPGLESTAQPIEHATDINTTSIDDVTTTMSERIDSNAQLDSAQTGTRFAENSIAQMADQTPASIKQLALQRRKELQTNPGDKAAAASLQEIAKWYVLQTNHAIDNNDLAMTRFLIAQANEALPHAFFPQQLLVVENQLLRREAIQNHLQQARKHIDTGNLVVPAGQNAVDSLNAVLSIDPEHTMAKQLLTDIANQYREKANNELAAGKPHEALSSVELGLTVTPNNDRLLQLKQTIQQEVLKQEKILSLLIQAEAQFQAGKAVEPRGESAIELYTAVLKQQPNNQQARAGVNNVEAYVVKQIQTAIWENKLAIGQRILTSALVHFPNSPKLDQAGKKLASAMATRAPRITHIIISDHVITSLLTEQAPILVNPNLYIGFTYTNFKKETTILNIQLVALDEKQVLVKKKLIVSEENGEHTFSIKHPQATFIRGNYRIIIKLKDKELVNQSFVVQAADATPTVTITR